MYMYIVYHTYMCMYTCIQLAHYDEQPMDDDEPIYDRLRTSENQVGNVKNKNFHFRFKYFIVPTPLSGSPRANVYQKQPRSPKSSQRGRHDDNTGFTRVRGRQGVRDHMHAQQITENIRAEERARSGEWVWRCFSLLTRQISFSLSVFVSLFLSH